MEDKRKLLEEVEKLKVEVVINRARIRSLRRRINKIDTALEKIREKANNIKD